MNKLKRISIIGSMTFILTGMVCYAQNPIIQNVYTADPAPMVHNDTLFLFTGHDEDIATEKGFILRVANASYLILTTGNSYEIKKNTIATSSMQYDQCFHCSRTDKKGLS